MTLNLEKDDIENTIDLDCLVFNKSVSNMEAKYMDHLTEVNELKSHICGEMKDIMLGMKTEELNYLEQVRETCTGMMAIEYNFTIPEGILTAEPSKLDVPGSVPVEHEKAQEAKEDQGTSEKSKSQPEKVRNNTIFPNLLEKDLIVSGAHSIVANNVSRALDGSQDLIDTRGSDADNWNVMKSQAQAIGHTVKEKASNVGRSFLTGIFDAANSLKSIMDPVSTGATRELDENMEFTKFQSWFRRTILTGAEGVSDDMFRKFEADLANHDIMRREVIEVFQAKPFPSKTMPRECYLTLSTISAIFLRVCTTTKDYLNSILFLLEVEDFHYIRTNSDTTEGEEAPSKEGVRTILASEVLNHAILMDEEFWVDLNIHLYNKFKYYSNVDENPDVRYLLGEMSVYKNLELCKQKLVDEEKFLSVWNKTLTVLEVGGVDESQSEPVKIVKGICLEFWNKKTPERLEKQVKENGTSEESGEVQSEKKENGDLDPKEDEVKVSGDDLIFLTEV